MNKPTIEFTEFLEALKEAAPTIRKQVNEKRTGGLLDDRRLLKLLDAYEKYLDSISE